MSRIRVVIGAVAGLACCLVTVVAATGAAAVVSTPKDGNYMQFKRGVSSIQFQLSHDTVTNVVRYDNCVVVPIRMPSLKVVDGAFSYTGTPLDELGHLWRLHIDGTFVSSTRATGHWRATRLSATAGCTSRYAFTATRQ